MFVVETILLSGIIIIPGITYFRLNFTSSIRVDTDDEDYFSVKDIVDDDEVKEALDKKKLVLPGKSKKDEQISLGNPPTETHSQGFV